LLFPPSKFLESAHCFLFDLDWKFWKTFGFEFIKMPQSVGRCRVGVGLISLYVIVPTTYLVSWALVAFVITSKLLLNFCSFLLKVIGVSSLGPFPFLVHLIWTWNFFPFVGYNMCAPFWIINWKMHKSLS
jgi:hypothetical protein